MLCAILGHFLIVRAQAHSASFHQVFVQSQCFSASFPQTTMKQMKHMNLYLRLGSTQKNCTVTVGRFRHYVHAHCMQRWSMSSTYRMLSAVLLYGPQRLRGMRWSIGRGARKLLQMSLQVILDGNESCLPHATRAHPNKAGSSTCKPTLFETPLFVRRHKWLHVDMLFEHVWAFLGHLWPFLKPKVLHSCHSFTVLDSKCCPPGGQFRAPSSGRLRHTIWAATFSLFQSHWAIELWAHVRPKMLAKQRSVL